jgi:hypothetical protein
VDAREGEERGVEWLDDVEMRESERRREEGVDVVEED